MYAFVNTINLNAYTIQKKIKIAFFVIRKMTDIIIEKKKTPSL